MHLHFVACTELEPLTDEARMEVVRDYLALLTAKHDIMNSYDYTGSEKVAKCQELSEVSRCAVAAPKHTQSATSRNSIVLVYITGSSRVHRNHHVMSSAFSCHTQVVSFTTADIHLSQWSYLNLAG